MKAELPAPPVETRDVDDGAAALLPAAGVEPPPPPWLDTGDTPLDASKAPFVPYVGAFYSADHPEGPSASPAIVAYKRALSRAEPDVFQWGAFDEHHNRRFAAALKRFQRSRSIRPASGNIGRATHDALRLARAKRKPGEWAFDGIAIEILKDEAKPKPPSHDQVVAQVRAAMADYWRDMIRFKDRWSYLQRRAMQSFGVAPSAGGRSDCSETATAGYFMAKRVTGHPVRDPNGRWFDGYGNTDSLVKNPEMTSGDYQIGDLALYGYRGWRGALRKMVRAALRPFGASYTITKHVVACYQPGDAHTAAWCSHGSNAGPLSVRLHYRADLLVVVRPPLLTS